MRLKKDDQVVVLTGRDRGKKGKIMKVSLNDATVLVEKINYRTVYLRRTQQNPQGGIQKVEGKLQVSNVQLICPRCSKAARVSYTLLADGTKQRTCKKCHDIL